MQSNADVCHASWTLSPQSGSNIFLIYLSLFFSFLFIDVHVQMEHTQKRSTWIKEVVQYMESQARTLISWVFEKRSVQKPFLIMIISPKSICSFKRCPSQQTSGEKKKQHSWACCLYRHKTKDRHLSFSNREISLRGVKLTENVISSFFYFLHWKKTSKMLLKLLLHSLKSLRLKTPSEITECYF